MKTAIKNQSLTIRDISPRMYLSPNGELHDCTAQGHTRFALDNHANIKTGWIRIVFISDRYSGQRLVIESKKTTESQANIIADIIQVSKVQTVSMYDSEGDETRIVAANAEKYLDCVLN